EAAGGTDRFGNLARLHLGDLVRDDRRQLRAAPPSQRAALDVRAAVRISDRELCEILARARLLVDLLGACGARFELLRRRRDGYRDENVGDVVLGIAIG